MVSDDLRERVLSYVRYQSAKPRDAIIALVRDGQQKFLAVVQDAGEALAARKPAPDEWSLRELTLHAAAVEARMAESIAQLGRGRRPDRAGDGPGFVPPNDGRPFAALLGELRAANEAMLGAIGGLPDPPDIETTIRHEWFGEINCLGWAVLQRSHDEDHAQHARKIIATARA